MKMRTMIKSVGACALACGAMGVAASAASAGQAQTAPATGLVVPFGSSLTTLEAQTGGQGVTVSPGCPSWVSDDSLGIEFQSGNSVAYRIDPTTGIPNGGNAEGQATLVQIVGYDQYGNPITAATPVTDTGHAHVWFGYNTNPNYNPEGGNRQTWSAETLSFNASGSDGSSLNVSVSFGGGSSASGNQSGWLHVKVTCS